MADYRNWDNKSRRYRREAEKTYLAPGAEGILGQLAGLANNAVRVVSPQWQSTDREPAGFFSTIQPYPPPNANNQEPLTIRDYSSIKTLPQVVQEPRAATGPIVGTVVEKDPYQHIDHLGSGAYGYVDTVRRVGGPSQLYARKTIRITSGRNREVQMRSVEQEFKTLSRLKHQHIISVLEMYSHRNKLSIIMLDVADMDMKEYLEKLDGLAYGAERHQMMLPLVKWQGCLIQAIDYLHEMKVKHKDLKPANILINDGNVIVTDFGIAKDLIDEETTASLNTGGAQGSPMYMAPETALGARRGRAVDIFSLGCIFLEIQTCLIGGPGARVKFAEFRNVNGSRAFSRCPEKLLQWIWFLWGCYGEYNFLSSKAPHYPLDSVFLHTPDLPGELAFMMLDPNPKTRITSRQLVRTIHCGYITLSKFKRMACGKCSSGPMLENSNLPLHSTFKSDEELIFPQPTTAALTTKFEVGWEEVKRLWLHSHMWW